MNRFKCLLAAATLVLIAATLSQAADEKATAGKQQAQKLQRIVKVTLDYLLYLPADYAQKPSWPLMLFLHGAGERGGDLELVKMHGPPKLIAAGKQFPFIVVSPQCPKNRRWEPFELSSLLDEITEKYKVDKDRIYVTGLSMGGFGTWALAGHSPDRFAALAPICGGGEPQFARWIAHIPAWVFHGAKDPVVPLSRSESMVEALKKRGGNVKLTVYPEVGHDSWKQAYDDPELYTWLLQQTRASQKLDEKKK
jgi:predicted peptidase